MRNLHGLSAATAFLFASFAAASPAQAQDAPQQSPLVEALANCRSEADDAVRLRCYDAAAGALAEASSKGEVVLVDRNEVRRTRRSLFGFNLPKLPFFGGDDSQGEENDEVDVTLTSARMIDSGKYMLSFDDGSTWQTTEGKPIRPRKGDKVTIKKASLGSYFLRVGGRSVRGMRVK